MSKERYSFSSPLRPKSIVCPFSSLIFGSIMLLSITSNIFLMHLFLEPAELGELFYTGFLFAINIYIVLRNKEGVKAIFDKSL